MSKQTVPTFVCLLTPSQRDATLRKLMSENTECSFLVTSVQEGGAYLEHDPVLLLWSVDHTHVAPHDGLKMSKVHKFKDDLIFLKVLPGSSGGFQSGRELQLVTRCLLHRKVEMMLHEDSSQLRFS